MTDKELTHSENHKTDDQPVIFHLWKWAIGLTIFCIFPGVLLFFGADFSTHQMPMGYDNFLGKSSDEIKELALQTLSGSITYTLLACTVFIIALFVSVLAFLQYRLTHEPVLPVIGIASSSACVIGGLQILVAVHLIDSTAINEAWIPFTQAASRFYYAIILMVGVGLYAFPKQLRLKQPRKKSLIVVCVVVLFIAYFLIMRCSISYSLPITMFPEALIKRPFDIYPLIPYMICALIIYPKYLRHHKSIFAYILFLMLIPDMATQLYLAFGSTQLHDSCFNIAYATKFVSYLVPLLGLLSEFSHAYHERQIANQQLWEYSCKIEMTNLELEDQKQELENHREQLVITNNSLEEAKGNAEHANATKSEFLANMSHEIRTPMTAILGFAEQLLQPDLNENERVDAIQTIRRNGKFLLQIINDILDLSKIEAGRLEVEKMRCSPIQVVLDSVSLMRNRADAKGLTIDVKFESSIPEDIDTDPMRLRQILINLLSNAIKFTQSGSITVSSKCIKDHFDKPLMQFDIIDTGIGLSDDQLRKLFQPFTQADTSTNRKFGGTGLGLTICKRLATVLGGDVTATSELNKGSTFSLTVTTGDLEGVWMMENPEKEISIRTAPHKEKSKQQLNLNGVHILLVEDGIDNQRLISYFLNKAGGHVELADNGVEAIKKINDSLEQNRGYDIVIMDMQMPLMDGYEATRQLRLQNYQVPIVALTAHAMSDDRKKCIDAGCDDYLAKPIDRNQILETISRLVTLDSVTT